MIKARKNNTIILGLSEENIKRLKKDQPIKFSLKDLKLKGIDPDDVTVFIFAGKDEQTMALTLESMATQSFN